MFNFSLGDIAWRFLQDILWCAATIFIFTRFSGNNDYIIDNELGWLVISFFFALIETCIWAIRQGLATHHDDSEEL